MAEPAGFGRRRFLALASVAAAAACGSTVVRDRRVRWRPVEFAPPAGATARVSVWRPTAAGWWASGAVVSADREFEPGLWRSPDGVTWERLTTAPATFYGASSDLVALAVGPDGAVCLGTAAGKGIHGNPRRAQWRLDGNMLREVVTSFEQYGGPQMVGFRALTHGPTGYALIGTRRSVTTGRTGAAVWVSPTGDDMELLDTAPGLAPSAGEQTNGLGITATAAGYVAVGDGFATTGTDATTHGRAWVSDDARSWTPAPFERAGAPTSVQTVDTDGAVTVAAGVVTDGAATRLAAWSSTDPARRWVRHDIGVLGADATAAVTEATTVAVGADAWWVGGRLGTTPVLARSRDGGRHWTAVALPADVPSSPQARVAVAVRRGLVLVSITTAERELTIAAA